MTWTAIFSIQDEKGKVSTTEFNMPTATPEINARLMAQEVAKLVNDQITGAITRIGIIKNVELPGALRASPLAGSDVEEGGRFQFRTAGGFYTGMRLPTFDESFVSPGSRVIDTTETEVAAFVTALVTGINTGALGGTGTTLPCDKRGDDITALEFAREQFLSSRG